MDTDIFATGKKAPQAPDQSSYLRQGISDVERRLRTLEERFSNLERRSQVTEENMLGSDKKIRAEIKLVNEEFSEMKGLFEGFSEKIKALIREFQGFAKVEDVDVIKKYLNLIEPLDFVTQNEVKRIVDDAIEDALSLQASEGNAKQ